MSVSNRKGQILGSRKIRGDGRFNGYPTGNLQNGEASKIAEFVQKGLDDGLDRQVKTIIGGSCVTQ